LRVFLFFIAFFRARITIIHSDVSCHACIFTLNSTAVTFMFQPLVYMFIILSHVQYKNNRKLVLKKIPHENVQYFCITFHTRLNI
jgi:hypothetical protein